MRSSQTRCLAQKRHALAKRKGVAASQSICQVQHMDLEKWYPAPIYQICALRMHTVDLLPEETFFATVFELHTMRLIDLLTLKTFINTSHEIPRTAIIGEASCYECVTWGVLHTFRLCCLGKMQ